MNPKFIIDLKKLEHNARFLKELCEKKGIKITAVTKVFCADNAMMQALLRAGITSFGDSRVENLEEYPKEIGEKIMLRLPSPNNAMSIVQNSDISLNSEIKTITALGEAAKTLKKRHSIILMIDLGDLREGVFFQNLDEIFDTVKAILEQEYLDFKGIGTNLTCYGSVIPDADNLSKLCEIAVSIEKHFGIKLEVVSGGNSSSLYMLDTIPKGINHLRLGEAIVRGIETAFGKPFPGLETDIVVLSAQIIEIKEKPSMPIGKRTINAFGQECEYIDRGLQKRAILAVGLQDTVLDGLTPINPKIEIIGASSDHLLIDISQADGLNIGDEVQFSLSYGAILSGFTSKYINKTYK